MKLLLETKEKIICIFNNTPSNYSFGYVVCEGSVVYDLNYFFSGKPFIIKCLLKKKINHVSYDPLRNLPIFSSLYNENKKDDKVYFYEPKTKSVRELYVNDIIPSDVRIADIVSSSGFGTFIHLGF